MELGIDLTCLRNCDWREILRRIREGPERTGEGRCREGILETVRVRCVEDAEQLLNRWEGLVPEELTPKQLYCAIAIRESGLAGEVDPTRAWVQRMDGIDYVVYNGDDGRTHAICPTANEGQEEQPDGAPTEEESHRRPGQRGGDHRESPAAVREKP